MLLRSFDCFVTAATPMNRSLGLVVGLLIYLSLGVLSAGISYFYLLCYEVVLTVFFKKNLKKCR